MEKPRALRLRGGKQLKPFRQSDARLVRRASKGDKAAFADIFERYGQDLYRYLRAILGDPDEAQDVLQNTMARALRALPGERRSLVLRPWLYRVARNEAINAMREREPTVELTEAHSEATPAADIRAEHREAVRSLVADLAALPEAQRTALVLHELNGLSHDEISEAMQRSPRASRQAIYEARLALQELKEGRDMDCEEVREALADGDGRVARGRKIRAHLRSCQACADFELGIRERKERLELLAPPLPAAAISGLLAGALGTGGAAGVGAAGALGTIGGTTALKSVGIVGASLAIGAGGASLAGFDLPMRGSGPDRVTIDSAEQSRGEENLTRDAAAPGADQPGGEGSTDEGRADDSVKGNENGEEAGNGGGRGNGPPEDAGPEGDPPGSGSGTPDFAPAGNGRPEAPPGQIIAEEPAPGRGPEGAAPPAGVDSPVHSNAGGDSNGSGKPDN